MPRRQSTLVTCGHLVRALRRREPVVQPLTCTVAARARTDPCAAAQCVVPGAPAYTVCSAGVCVCVSGRHGDFCEQSGGSGVAARSPIAAIMHVTTATRQCWTTLFGQWRASCSVSQQSWLQSATRGAVPTGAAAHQCRALDYVGSVIQAPPYPCWPTMPRRACVAVEDTALRPPTSLSPSQSLTAALSTAASRPASCTWSRRRSPAAHLRSCIEARCKDARLQ